MANLEHAAPAELPSAEVRAPEPASQTGSGHEPWPPTDKTRRRKWFRRAHQFHIRPEAFGKYEEEVVERRTLNTNAANASASAK
jgi:hypothetical protein